MKVARLIAASVLTQGVFERFAKLSKKDKDAVVEKVKEKVNGKGKANGKKDDKKKGKKPAKGKVPPQFEKGKKKPKDEEKPVEEEAVVEEEVVEEEETTDKKPEKGKVPPQFQKGKKDEEEAGVEAPTDESDGDESKSLDNIVGDLAEEIEVIKSDGHIAPNEVVGLIDNVVKMVHVLLQAKPGKPKKASSERELAIAERIVTATLEEAAEAERGV